MCKQGSQVRSQKLYMYLQAFFILHIYHRKNNVHLEILSSISTFNYVSILINVLGYALLVLVMDLGSY